MQNPHDRGIMGYWQTKVPINKENTFLTIRGSLIEIKAENLFWGGKTLLYDAFCKWASASLAGSGRVLADD